MKKVIETVCRRFCAFYRQDKEVLLCGALRFVAENYNIKDAEAVSDTYRPDYALDRWILKRVCLRCEFYTEGCGFRSGEKSPPCGGYILLEALRKQNP